MMKPIIRLTILLILMASCAVNNKSIQKKEGYGGALDASKFHIFFESGFRKTQVAIGVGSEIILFSVISTNESIELARAFDFGLPSENLPLIITIGRRSFNFQLNDWGGYNILLINKGLFGTKFTLVKKNYYYD